MDLVYFASQVPGGRWQRPPGQDLGGLALPFAVYWLVVLTMAREGLGHRMERVLRPWEASPWTKGLEHWPRSLLYVARPRHPHHFGLQGLCLLPWQL